MNGRKWKDISNKAAEVKFMVSMLAGRWYRAMIASKKNTPPAIDFWIVCNFIPYDWKKYPKTIPSITPQKNTSQKAKNILVAISINIVMNLRFPSVAKRSIKAI